MPRTRGRRVIRDVARAIASASLALTLIACDPVLRVKGVVHDEHGRPLDQVIVTLHTEGRPPRQAITAKDGSFSVGIVGAEPRDSKVSFGKDGFKTVEQPLGSRRELELDITLKPN